VLAKGPADLATLSQRLGLHPRSARDFLDALVALTLTDRQDGRYRNTPETDLYLDRGKPSYVGGLLEMANARLYSNWGLLTEALKTGRNQNESKESGDVFGALYADPARLRGFLAAMSGGSLAPAHALAAKFPWQGYKTFADIGTAQGMVPATLARAHPHLIGAGFDLPEVKPIFDEFIAGRGVSDRVKFLAGNFLTDPSLPSANVLIMGHILHDWDLAQKRMLLEKAFAALPKGGALIVYETMIDDERRENAMGLLMSLNMLIETPGGFDFTGADCQAWMRDAGFSETRVEPLTGPQSMAVAIK
jgi:O-methyltransferase domain